MRSFAIPALLLTALAGLALTPMAAAEEAAAPPQPCNGTVGGGQTYGPVTVFASPPCYTVEVKAMSCPISGHWDERRVNNVAVRIYVCDDPTTADAGESASSTPCTCPPPPVCTPVYTVGPIAYVASITVYSNCRVQVDLLRIIACTGPLDGTHVITQGLVTVTAPCKPQFDPCEPPFDCYPEVQAWPPVCIERNIEQGAITGHVGQCGPQYVAFDNCDGGGVQTTHYYNDLSAVKPIAGLAYVQVDHCLPHSPPPGASAETTASDPGPCGAVQARCPAPVPLCYGIQDELDMVALSSSVAGYDVAPNCHVTVSADLIDCLWGEHWVEHSAGPATVRYTECSSPEETMSQQQPCTCPPPAPLCRPITQMIADRDDAVDWTLSEYCKVTVTVDVTKVVDCIFGHHEQRSVGPVTVIYPVCESPCGGMTCQPPMVSTMADPFPTCIRECSPVGLPSGCELKAATPTTVGPFLLPFNPQQFVWGNDCDIDVDPIGACAPPSGSTIERDVLYFDVRILVCDGGIGDIGTWS